MFTYKILAVVVLAVATRAQLIGSGSCPEVEVVQDFDVEAYLGKWYEIKRYPQAFEHGNCSTANYGPVSDEGVVKVRNEEIRNGQPSSIEGTAELADPASKEAKLIVTFIVPPVNETKADYWVLGTDYENFALVWSCSDLPGLFNFQSAWILAREKPLAPEHQAKVDELIEKNGIRGDAFSAHDQEDCLTSS